MNRADYLAQVEALRASPELRARIAGLADTVRPRRRIFQPWMGACACLALIAGLSVGLYTGRIPLPGGSAGGGGHDEASTFMSYAGPVFPLTLREENDSITAQRDITLDFAPWQREWVSNEEEVAAMEGLTDPERQEALEQQDEWFPDGGYYRSSDHILVTDAYTLTNRSDADQTVTVLYPFASSLDQLGENLPTLTLDGTELEGTLRIGAYSGSFEGAWDGTLGGDPEGSVNLDYANSWEDYRALLADGTYLERAMGPLPDLSGVPAIVYRFTDPWGEPENDDAGIPNPTIRVTFSLDYDKTRVLTTGFHAGMYDRENGIMGKGFSIPQPGELRPTEEWCLIVVGEDISDLAAQGYVTGGWDTEETIEAGVTMERYETDLATALCTLYLDERWDELEGQPGLTYEQYCGLAFDHLLAYGLLSDEPMERYDDGMLTMEFSQVDRVCWLEAQVTVPARGSVALTASLTKEASYDFYCAHTKNQGISGYDLVTRLGSNLPCTSQTVTLEDRGQIQIVRQNFGFDLENGVKSVALDPDVEHYYLEVRRAS